MKFSTITATLLCVATCVYALPVLSAGDVDELVERSYNTDDLELREWLDIEARTGSFRPLQTAAKKLAHAFVDSAHKGGQLHGAATAGSAARTTKHDGGFHLDRQQPSNSAGQHKVAVQLNHVGKKDPSTVGQVAIHGGAKVSESDARVARKLKQSISTGRETHINHPNSKGAKNSAANAQKHEAKQNRVAAKQKAGNARAAAGNFKKGRK